MRNLCCIMLLAGVFVYSSADEVFVEDFEAAFPTWESGWLGVNSNLQNYYGIGGYRGNNPDGLWLDDGDGQRGTDDVVINFENGFGADVTSLSIDITTWVTTDFVVWDNDNNIIYQVDAEKTRGALTDPGTYQNLSIASSNGIFGFGFLYDGGQIEGNTSIDNIMISKSGASVPEPGTVSLIGLGLMPLFFVRRKKT